MVSSESCQYKQEVLSLTNPAGFAKKDFSDLHYKVIFFVKENYNKGNAWLFNKVLD